MHLSIKKDIDCERYSVIIKFKEWGGKILTPEDEQKVIQDYCPKFKLSDLIFSGKYTVEDENKIVKKSDDFGNVVTLNVSNKYIEINEDLEIYYSIHMDEVKATEKKGTLKTEDLVCKAKIQLFIDTIIKKINDIFTELSKKLDSEYEEEEIIEIN